MAAYAALVSLAQVLKQILLVHDQDQHRTLPRPQQRIKSLHENVILLIGFLDYFPEEATTLEGRLRSAAKQAEDIIEFQISDEILSAEDIIEFQLSDEILSPENRCFGVLSCFGQVLRSLHIAIFSGNQIGEHTGHKLRNWKSLHKKLQNVIEETDSIVKEVNQIKSIIKGKDLISSQSVGSNASRIGPNGSRDADTTVVGFEQDLMIMKKRLCGESFELETIPIYGMGGIGKTTLARYAYDDPLILYHFDVRVWMTISLDYELRKILVGLMHSVGESFAEGLSDEFLKQHLYKYLKGRRYLIVMDDMWNTRVWDDLRSIFPNDNNGSRIMITARELGVASYAHSCGQPHLVNLMNIDHSLNLLRQKVFAQERCPPELAQIGRVIAKNCQGLPLAIAVIAGILSKVDRMPKTWMNIAKTVRQTVNTKDEQFLEILSLSYTHLPHHLRPCFLYSGVFPEDFKIDVSKLIKLWAGEGFLRSNGFKDVEELAEEYLEDLAKRSLVMVIEKKYNGRIKSVKIHDLLRDLCLRKALEEKFIHVVEGVSSRFPQGLENSHGISFLGDVRCDFPEKDVPTIQTILFFTKDRPDSSLSGFRLLKVVDMLHLLLYEYPVELGELFHLRYLAFKLDLFFKSKRNIKIPGSLSKLQNLLTLIIKFDNVSFMPFEIWTMPQLKHLILLNATFLPDPRTRLESLALENLHSLRWVRNFTFSEWLLKLIPNLKNLRICYWWRDLHGTGWSGYCLKNLVYLYKLEKLNIRGPFSSFLPSDLSRNIAFPVTLKKLTLSGRHLIPWKDMTIIGSLPSLEVLKLMDKACQGDVWETREEEFCRLKVLLIVGMELGRWITECDHFPSLERLVLYDCSKLVKIPDSIGEIETLRLIEVDHSNSSLVESAQCIQKDQQEKYANDYLQVRALIVSPSQKKYNFYWG